MRGKYLDQSNSFIKKLKMKRRLLNRQARAVTLGLFFLHSVQMLFAQDWAGVTGIVAQDVAVGKNGSVWAIGINNMIFRWNAVSWETMPGSAVRIAVDPAGNAWVITSNGNIFRYNLNSKGWDVIQALATDLGMSADGSAWIIGRNHNH